MKNNRAIIAWNSTLLLVAAALFGCSAGVKAKTGTGGASGSGASAGGAGATGTGGSGNSGGGSTGNSSGGVDANLSPDAACAASTVGAEPVPLDLYFLMDSSKSMLDATGTGTTSKWTAVGSALNTFFSDPGSAGLGVAIKYFPDEQPAPPSGPPATCTMDAQCTVGGTSYGACDRRETCVGSGASTTEVSPLCLSAATDCGGGTQTCSLIQDCSNGNYCAAGPTAAANACTIPGTTTPCSTFPGYCHLRDICTSSDYATPNVPMLTLPDTAGALMASLGAHTPDGYTPTGPALEGAVAFAQQRLASNPDHKVAIVLVTDGLPGGFLPGFPPPECEPSNISGAALPSNTSGLPNISAIAMAASTANPPILTFVVGIFNPATAEGAAAPANLLALATAGGTGSAVILDVTQNDVTAKLHAALTQAQTKAIACSYQIPTSTHGGIDFTKVNVQFTGGTGTMTTVGQTTGKDACSAGGWYYDVDPSVGTPTKIIACDSTCSQFQTDTSGHVDIVLGCMTIKIG
jgi:hypothetical protein